MQYIPLTVMKTSAHAESKGNATVPDADVYTTTYRVGSGVARGWHYGHVPLKI